VVTTVDTNVISALWSQEPIAQQMVELLEDARREGRLLICAPVFAELHAYPGATGSFVEQFLNTTGIEVDFCIDESVWRRAATAYASYAQRRRAAGGVQTKRLLVDFVVGAHALLESDRLLSLDVSRYDRDYPELAIASP
jgi:predicted nucleic acid-binding protein